MYKKRFYRANGSERKRKHRQKIETAKVLSDVNDSTSDSADNEDINDRVIDNSAFNRDLDMETRIIDDHLDDNRIPDLQTTNDESNDEEGGDEDFEDLFTSFDNNRERKLYSSTTLSIYDGCLEIIKISRELNLNKLQINRLLSGIRLLLPIDNKLPRTLSGLFKVIGKY